MKLLIDEADLKKIERLAEYYPLEGVTTNPTIIARTGQAPFTALHALRDFFGPDADVHAQVVARDAAGMMEDARRIVREIGENTFIKIPCVPEGFKAMRALKKEGFRITATTVYTPMQAYLAAKCGADWVAPYVNRIDAMGFDGTAVTQAIQDIFDNNGYATGVLAASFKNSQQVLELCRYGVKAVTVSGDVLEGFVRNAAIDASVDAFTADFEKLCGKGKTMADC